MSCFAALRNVCAYYGISQSGGKAKCDSRIVNHMTKLELELLENAGKQASEAMERVPVAQPLATHPLQVLVRQLSSLQSKTGQTAS